jgi:transposase
MRTKLSKNVREKIAFEVFVTTKSHRKIAEKYNISRSLVSSIASEFGVNRREWNGANRPKGSKSESYEVHDIETVNWTFDDNLIIKRIERRKESIEKEINRLKRAII